MGQKANMLFEIKVALCTLFIFHYYVDNYVISYILSLDTIQ